MRRNLGLLLAVVAVSWLAPASAQEPGALAQITALLEDRARAMHEGDRAGWMAPLADDDPAFVRRQGFLFDGFQELGLADFRLDLGTTWPELTGRRERRAYRDDVKVLHVEERSRIRGYDRQPSLEDQYLTFVRRGGRWLLVSDSDLGDLAIMSGRRLWENGPIATRRSEHFVYVSHPGLTSSAGPVLEAAERALRRVERVWPLPWRKKVMILAPSSTGELERMIQATFDLDVFVAFAASGVDRATDWDLVGHRIMLNRSTFEGRSPSSNEEILTHELLHIATREDAGPMTSIFVEEGVAEWVTGGASTSLLASAVRSGDFDRRLPLDHEFTAGSGTEIVTAYQESSTAITFAADAYGDRAISAFYRTLGEPRRDAGTWRYHADRAMRQAFGVGYRRFEKAWAGWVEEELG
ncbi:MAG TPA: hypothetical protein VGB28_04890 [Actinomycetota bacterium]|jgi:hypothetical protein